MQRTTEALIDTGCGLSVTSRNFVSRLHLNFGVLQPGDPKMLIGANGSHINVLGKITLSIKLNGLTVPFDFLVADRLTQNIILGHDFLTETKALISYADSSVTFFDHLVELKLLSKKRDSSVYHF